MDFLRDFVLIKAHSTVIFSDDVIFFTRNMLNDDQEDTSTSQ